MSVAAKIKEKLEANFDPSHLKIRDDSDKHRGHAGHDGRGESHFYVEMVTPVFRGKMRVERQRMVYAVLQKEMESRIHALSLKLLSPEEHR